MNTRPPLSILALTVLGFCTLYAPQPLLPILAEQFGVGAGQASLLITVTLLPLALAPLLYGYILEDMPARRMMVAATGVLALCQLLLSRADDWHMLVLLRVIEGLALPALFTALMTFVAHSVPREQVRQAMAWYIAATIVGGFSGRAISGLLASFFDWRMAMLAWTPALLIIAWVVLGLPRGQRSHFNKVTPRVFSEVMREPGLAAGYVAILCIFFVFAAVLNVLPFRMSAIDPAATATGIGFAYIGYLSGLLISLNATRLKQLLGNEGRVYFSGMLLYTMGLALFVGQSTAGIYLAMFAFCGGMFLVHSRLSGQLNHLAHDHKGIVNGIYIAAYYMGGALGSWLPAEFYRHYGWLPFLLLLSVFMAAAAIALRSLFRRAEIS